MTTIISVYFFLLIILLQCALIIADPEIILDNNICEAAMRCSNCIEIDNHIFGLYSVVGFMDKDAPCPFDGYWAGVVFIRQHTDMSGSYPNNIITSESYSQPVKDESIINKSIKTSVLVTDNLKDYIFQAYLDKKPLLLEIIRLSKKIDDDFDSVVSVNAIQAILPYGEPIISKTVKRDSILQ